MQTWGGEPLPLQEWRALQAMKEQQQIEKGLGLEERQEQKLAPAEVQATHQMRIQNGLMKAQRGVQPLKRFAAGEPPRFQGRLMAKNVERHWKMGSLSRGEPQRKRKKAAEQAIVAHCSMQDREEEDCYHE